MLSNVVLPKGRVRAYIAFFFIYVSYVSFYFNRKNYSFWFNELVTTVGMPLEQASAFGSAMELSYGIGKLVAGPVVDTATSPALILWGTLAISSICNIFLFSTDFYVLNVALWSANGIIQSAAWPALAIIFLNWFRNAPNKGTMYSILSTSQNMGSGLVPIILTPIVARFGWRSATAAPGMIGLSVAAALLLLLEEKPEKNNLLTESDLKEKPVSGSDTKKSTASNSFQSWKKSAMKIFESYEIRCLAAGYALLTVVRVGIADWSILLLQDLRSLSAENARDCLVTLELGGFIGGMVTGSISDFMFKGERSPVMFWFCMFMFPCIIAIIWAPMDSSASAILTLVYGMFGFVSFGPHMLVGLLARELYPEAPSTAGSYCKFIGQLGGTLAGLPLSLVASSSFGWNAVGVVLSVCTVSAGILFGQAKRSKSKSA